MSNRYLRQQIKNCQKRIEDLETLISRLNAPTPIQGDEPTLPFSPLADEYGLTGCSDLDLQLERAFFKGRLDGLKSP